MAEDNNNLPSMDDFLHEEQLPSVEDYIEKEEVVEEIEETVEPEEVESTVDLTEILRLISDVRKDIPEIPEIKEYDAELAAICEVIDDLREQIPVIPEVKYYDDELEAVCEQIDWVKEYIQTLPEVKYYDEQISSIEDRINNLPEVKYYEKDIESIKEDFEKLREDIKLIPDFSWIAKTFKDVDSDVNVLNDAVDTLSEKTRLEFERFNEDLEIRTFDNKVSIDNLKEENKQFSEKVSEEKDKIWKELSAFSLKIWEHHKQFKDDDRKLRKQILGEYNVLKKNIEEKLEEVNQSSVKTDELLLDYFKELKEQVDSLPEVKYYDQQLSEVSDEVKGLYSIVEDIKKKQSVLKEERIVEQIVKVESPDQNFATLDDLQNHYRKFVSSIQQQLSSIGGGGETRLQYLDDITGIATNLSAYNGLFLKIDTSQPAGKKFVFAEASGGGSQTLDEVLSEGNTSSTGMSVGFITATAATFTGNVTVGGTITYEDVTNVDSLGLGTFRSGVEVFAGTATTALIVEGDTRITGILTVGSASVTIDGDNNTISTGIVTITNSSVIIGDNVSIDTGASGINSAPNVFYVAKDGDDDNNGTSIDNAKLTIAGAVSVASSGSVIKVLSGNYVESNPITLPAFSAVIGDDLRTVKVLPNTPTSDIFHVNKGCKVSNITFSGHTAPGAAIAFPSGGATNVGGGKWKGPYIQNCTSDTTTGTGIRIDGNLAEKTKSMNVDAFTQYNQGGVGVAVTNEGYAQLVSVFTICCDRAITCHAGGQADLANSNCSFGTLGLVADGKGSQQFIGTVTSSAAAAQDNVTINVGTGETRPYDGQIVFFDELYKSVETITVGSGGTGYTSTPTVTVAAPTGPNGETSTAFATLEGETVASITIISSGSQYQTTPAVTISAPNVGINTATATASMADIYYTINSATPIVSGITTLTLDENLLNTVGVGSTVFFFQQSKIIASSHTFEYIGSGNTITSATPKRGGVTIQANEVVSQNGGRVIYTSTDQAGNFRIGDDLQINQNTGTISGRAFSRSLFSEVTPFILALS